MQFHPVLGLSMPELGWVPSPRYLLRRDRILTWLPKSVTGAALEIGCGAGALLKDLRLRGYECTALETSGKAAKIARTAHAGDPGVEIFERAEEAEWTGRFDLAIACEVLEHIEDDTNALKEWVRWLKPDGQFVISVPGRPEKWGASDVWAGHFRRYTRKTLETLCLSAGLRLGRIESYGYPMINCIAPIRPRPLKKTVEVGQRGHEKEEATAASGIDRGFELRVFPLLNNLLGRSIIRLGCRWQRRFLDGDKGLGLLAWATKI
ncbi:MAG: class I SAM-dependent methyltransferase [Verrucomicrobia bacterium]|nr:MAG: class I SAM-dependent methyltransferase [Verrucomicrobiota bacterium]